MTAEPNPSMHLKEQKLSSEEIYHGRILHVTRDTVRIENGTEALREVVHHPGGACVVPLTADGRVIMVRQFRYPYLEETLEIPAGKLEYGEDPLACAERELSEEAGASADALESLGCLYPTPAYDTEIIYMYLARNIRQEQAQHLDPDEFLDIVQLSLAEAVAMVMRGEIRDAKTQTALLKKRLSGAIDSRRTVRRSGFDNDYSASAAGASAGSSAGISAGAGAASGAAANSAADSASACIRASCS